MNDALSAKSSLEVVVLAAGQGTRMQSALPKVLHRVGGRPLLSHVIDTAQALAPEAITIVYGHGGDQVQRHCDAPGLRWLRQEPQLGTGHALLQALPHIDLNKVVLVLYGDVPLIRLQTLKALRAVASQAPLALLTVRLDDPQGYGRIVRDEAGQVVRIVEDKDATPDERAINEVNTGILVGQAGGLMGWLNGLSQANAQGEYYLTDIVALAAREGEVLTRVCDDAQEVLGVNDKRQLATVERAYQGRQVEALLRRGVTLMDPARCDVRGWVDVGRDVTIDVNVILEGRVHLEEGVTIGAHCILRDTTVGAHTHVLPYSLIEGATLGAYCRVGPFARIRPQTQTEDHVHIGNFVEVKNASVAEHSKVNHLSYVGDSAIGRRVNIGAGTITCNYDGAHKHRTVIEDDAFIGSNSALVAPVTVGRGATIGAGSVITKDAPQGSLTLTRARQATVDGWQRPKKAKL